MIAFLRDNARWIAAGFLCTLFSSFGQTFFIALSSGHIRTELQLSHGQFGGIYTAATLIGAALLPVLGRQIDAIRLERFALMVICCLAGSMLLMAAAANVAALVVALVGLRVFGQGLMSHTAMTAIGRWFDSHRGRAVSLAALGHHVGESVMPITFVALAGLITWRGGWAAGAGMLMLMVLPAVYFLMRVPRSPQSAADETAKPQRQWTRGEVLRDPLFWVLAAGMVTPMAVGTTLFFHQVHFMEIRGWPLGWFAGATPILSVAAIVATLAAGHLADRFFVAALLPAMLLFLGLATLVMGHVDRPAAIIIFMALVGVSFGIYAVVYGALVPELYGTKHLGATRSVVTGLVVLSSAAGPGLSGWLIDAGIAYIAIVRGLGFLVLAMAVAMTAAALTARRRIAASAY